MGLFTRKVVGWKVDNNMRETLVREPLETALMKRKISECYDNANAESLWSRLKQNSKSQKMAMKISKN